jgi:hypothetical protein
MVSLNLTIKKGKKKSHKIVEFDADQFEKLAALFGMFNPDFLKSLARSERDIKAGRIREIKSLRELRKK